MCVFKTNLVGGFYSPNGCYGNECPPKSLKGAKIKS